MNYSESSSSTQVSQNDDIVAFPEEANTIMGQLLGGDSDLDVISIVGMAGVGKTTMALTLYYAPPMANHFDVRAFCSVSQSYRRRDLLLSILDQVDPFEKVNDSPGKSFTQPLSDMDDEGLLEQLYRRLKIRRYLIVLDDIWDTKVWDDLRGYFPDDGNSSRILITTRNRNVTYQTKSKVNDLHELSDAKSWELFQKKMQQRKDLPDQLTQIAQKIVKLCKGLPLSIVVIAGILSDIERTEDKWNEIADSVNSHLLLNPQGNCIAILLDLSYSHLEDQLRPCFLYLASFPENQEISVNQLINRWIGEGFVQDTNSETAEEVAKNYIKNLIVKSLVVRVKERLRGGVKTFRLHDLLRDFCLHKAEDNQFFTVLDNRYDFPLQLHDPTRLIINRPWIDGLSSYCHNSLSLISYFDVSTSEIENGNGSRDMVLLKVLEVGKMSTAQFPNISSLVHLRYLAFDFRYLDYPELPSSPPISKLENLEILILKYGNSIRVPDFIFDMMKLRHIQISEDATFKVKKKRLENSPFLLNNLRSLSKARVSWVDSKWESMYLRKLSGLQSLSCTFVEYDSDAGSDEDDVIQMDYSEEHLSRMVRFNDHLTSLKVRNDADWNQRFIRTCQLPDSLVELTMSKFYLELDDLLEIGRRVRNLEVFKIFDCSVPNEYEWNVVADEFPKLKVLKLRRFNFRKWITSEGSFPNLEQLWVEKCNFIEELPEEFGDLPNLRLISIIKCEPSLGDSAKEIQKEQHEQQNSEMRVLIDPRNR